MKHGFYKIIALAVCFFATASLNAQNIISTVAGNGTAGYAGDGGLANAATVELNEPTGITLDAAGNIYFTDRGNNRIRMISTSGIITTIAGNGTSGGSGDGGPATAAELNDPFGIAYGSGYIYFSDAGNNRVRMVDLSTGYIYNFAGNGTAGYSGDGMAATAAEFTNPTGLAVDAYGNVYIADQGNYVVREVSAGIIYPFAGNHVSGLFGNGVPATDAEFESPVGLAFDALGNLYISDQFGIVRVVDVTNTIYLFAFNGTPGYSGDGGAATAAETAQIMGVACDGSGNVFISAPGQAVVRYVNSANIINPYAGNYTLGSGFSGDGGVATSATLNLPWLLATDASGNLYIADLMNNRIRVVAVHSCIDSSNLSISSSERHGTCTYTATAHVSTVNEVLGYTWSGVGAAVVHHSHAYSDSYTFSVGSGGSAVISMLINVVDTNYTDTTGGACCQTVLTQTVTCGCGGGRMAAPTGASNPNMAAMDKISVFPNPANNTVTITSGKEAINTVQILDINGNEVATYTYNGIQEVSISLGKLTPGNYVVRVNNTTSKIISKTD